MKPFTRPPIIALDIKEVNKAQPGEMLIDYDNGHIYVLDKSGSGELISITRYLLEQLKSIDSNNIIVRINGEEERLYDIIVDFKERFKHALDVKLLNPDIKYIEKQYGIDMSSIATRLGYIEIKGFRDANTFTVPMKLQDGSLAWVELTDSWQIKNGVIGTDNPFDGRCTDVLWVEPINGFCYLRASRKQKSRHLTGNITVILPAKVVDEYSEITWIVETNSRTPILTFSSNVNFEYTKGNTNIYQDSAAIFTFKTWDHGDTWWGTVCRYKKPGSEDSFIDNANMDLDDLKEIFVQKETLENDYLPAHDIRELYATKEQLKELLEWKESIDQDLPITPPDTEGGNE